MDLWSMNAIMWNIERQSNIIVFNDLSLPIAVDAENGCIETIANFFAYIQYDSDFNSPYNYNIVMRIPGIYRNSTKNYDTFAKDW